MMLLTAGNTGVLSGQKTRKAEQAGGFVRIYNGLSHSQIAANYHFVQLSRQLWRILRFSMQSIFAADSMGWGCCPGLSAVGYSGRCCPAGALSISGAGADGPGLVVAGGEGFFYRWMGGVAEKEGASQRRGIGYIPHIPSSLP